MCFPVASIILTFFEFLKIGAFYLVSFQKRLVPTTQAPNAQPLTRSLYTIKFTGGEIGAFVY